MYWNECVNSDSNLFKLFGLAHWFSDEFFKVFCVRNSNYKLILSQSHIEHRGWVRSEADLTSKENRFWFLRTSNKNELCHETYIFRCIIMMTMTFEYFFSIFPRMKHENQQFARMASNGWSLGRKKRIFAVKLAQLKVHCLWKREAHFHDLTTKTQRNSICEHKRANAMKKTMHVSP